MQKVILASGSTNRKRMLRALGIPFKVVVSNFDEAKIKEKNPAKRARKVAFRKAKIVEKNHKAIIIAADTFTVCKGKVLEKPKDLNQAKLMLKELSGNKTICYTGFAFLNKKRNIKFSKTAITKVSFRKIYKKEIEKYVQKFPVTSWAAAYTASELYIMGMIKNVSGSLTGLTHGLPTEFLIPLLEKSGYKPKPAF